MHTLQECFVAYGEKFPFTVTLFKFHQIPEVYTFVAKYTYEQISEDLQKKHREHPEYIFWEHDRHEPEDDAGGGYHYFYAMEKRYKYEEHLFKRDIEDLINEDSEKHTVS